MRLPRHDEPRRALVLGAGAAYGAFQVGVLRHLIGRRRTYFSMMTGASVGALNAAILAQAEGPEELVHPYLQRLQNIWRGIHSSWQIMGRPWARDGLLGLLARLVYSAPCTLEPLRKLAEEHVDPGRLKESPITLAIDVACLNTGRIAVIRPEDPHFLDFLIASCSMPMFFPPVRIGAYTIPRECCESLGLSDGACSDLRGLPFPSRASLDRRLRNMGVYGDLSRNEVESLGHRLWRNAKFQPDLLWCDAYMRRILPLTSALKMCPEEVTVVPALPPSIDSDGPDGESKNLKSYMPRFEQTIGIFCQEVQRTNAATAGVLNNVLGLWAALDLRLPDDAPLRRSSAWQNMEDYLGRYHYVPEITVISPEPDFVKGDPLDFDPERINSLMKHGQQRAARAVPVEEPVLTAS